LPFFHIVHILSLFVLPFFMFSKSFHISTYCFPYFPYHFTIQPSFLLHFPYFSTI
jgi:hypothetical protein